MLHLKRQFWTGTYVCDETISIIRTPIISHFSSQRLSRLLDHAANEQSHDRPRRDRRAYVRFFGRAGGAPNPRRGSHRLITQFGPSNRTN
jgi:hypothetical protein